MGVNHKPEQRSYWSADLFYCMPLFTRTMTRDRFDQLSRYLHVAPVEVTACDRNSPASVLVGLYSSQEDYGRRESLETSGALCSHDL